MPYDAVTKEIDTASVSGPTNDQVYTNPRYMVNIVTGASGDKEGETPCVVNVLPPSVTCDADYGYGVWTALDANTATWAFKSVKQGGCRARRRGGGGSCFLSLARSPAHSPPVHRRPFSPHPPRTPSCRLPVRPALVHGQPDHQEDGGAPWLGTPPPHPHPTSSLSPPPPYLRSPAPPANIQSWVRG